MEVLQWSRNVSMGQWLKTNAYEESGPLEKPLHVWTRKEVKPFDFPLQSYLSLTLQNIYILHQTLLDELNK